MKRSSLTLALSLVGVLMHAAPVLAAVRARAYIGDGSIPDSLGTWDAVCFFHLPAPSSSTPGWWYSLGGQSWYTNCGQDLPADVYVELDLGAFSDRQPFFIRGTYSDSSRYFPQTCGNTSCGADGDCAASLPIGAVKGSLHGYVYLPDQTPVPGVVVAAYRRSNGSFAKSTTTDGSGHYDFTDEDAASQTNHWGLFVDQEYCNTPDHRREYSLTVAPIGQSTPAPYMRLGLPTAGVTSSELRRVDLYLSTPEKEESPEEERQPEEEEMPEDSEGGDDPAGDEGRPPVCDHNVGQPINVMTGNMHLDQTDATLPALRRLVRLTRSYNSARAYQGKVGAFGRGWSHSYEKTITPVPGFPQLLRVKKGKGVVAYFQDSDQDLTYEPSVPLGERSRIVKSGDTYTRYFDQGGTESYDAAGRLIAQEDRVGNVTLLGRDSSGLLTSITTPGGRTLTLSYEGSLVSSLSGPEGVIATYTYTDTHLQGVTYADASGYTFTYDDSGQLLTVSDRAGVTIETHTYSGGKALTSEVSGSQEKYTVRYDFEGQSTVTDALGNEATYFYGTFRGVRRLVGVNSSCCGGTSKAWNYAQDGSLYYFRSGAVERFFENNAQGHLLSSRRGYNPGTTFTRDSFGRVLTRTAPDGGLIEYSHGLAGPLTVANPLNHTTTLTYSPRGQLSSVRDAHGATTGFDYDGAGDLVAVTAPSGGVSRFTYDGLGRRTSVTNELGKTTRIAYNSRGRITKITHPDETFVTLTYNSSGRLVSVKDELNREIRYAYDAFGRLATLTDPAEGITSYAYDAMSRLVSITDARSKITRFEYDAANRVTKVIYPGERSEIFSYDEQGRLISRTDRKGITATYGYGWEWPDRIASTDYSDGSWGVYVYAFDAHGRPTSIENESDLLTLTYDLTGQLVTEESYTNGTTVSYGYDPAGNRTSLSLNGSSLLTYGYDGPGRLQTLTRGGAVFQFGYDLASRRTSLQNPNGTTTTYSYDDLSRLTSLTTTAAGGLATIATFAYGYDATGNRVGKQSLDNAEVYLYDALARLQEVRRDSVTTESYTYDPVGNRLSSLGSPGWTYSDRNELLRGNGAAFSYDANGNLTQKGEGIVRRHRRPGLHSHRGATWTYEWHPANILKRVLRNGVEVARFAYDPLGRRIQKVANGVTTRYVYAGQDILKEIISDGTSRTYIHGPGIDEPLAEEDASGSLSYYHADGLGSIVKATNALGLTVGSRRYDAWGNIETESGPPLPNELGGGGYAFTGREWDSEMGLYYYRARYYDPKIGRFISEDPIGLSGGDLNLYSYVSGAPTNFTDPSGLCPMCVAGALAMLYVLNNPNVANTTSGHTTDPIVSNVGLTAGMVGSGILAQQIAAGAATIADALTTQTADPNATWRVAPDAADFARQERAIIDELIRARGGHSDFGVGGVPPKSIAEAEANHAKFLEELRRRMSGCRR